jgi:cell division cycle 2-like protein
MKEINYKILKKIKQIKIIDKKKLWRIFIISKFFLKNIKNILIKKIYKRLGLIDQGTYGRVFRISRLRDKKIYACKEIKMEVKKNEILISSIHEIKILLSLRHPNLIFAKESFFGKYLSQLFIISEYCEYDLKSILNSQIKFSKIQIKYIMKQILRGRNILHENKIIHRDLKTSNILLNNRGLIKICDFGLARTHNVDQKVMTLGIVTLWYRAPEILLGGRIYTHSIDVWSVGCIFGELILSEVLFSGKSELDQLGKIFSLLGTPSSEIWMCLHFLPAAKKIKFPLQPYNNLSKKLCSLINSKGLHLIQRLLAYDPIKRISIKSAMKHSFFI